VNGGRVANITFKHIFVKKLGSCTDDPQQKTVQCMSQLCATAHGRPAQLKNTTRAARRINLSGILQAAATEIAQPKIRAAADQVDKCRINKYQYKHAIIIENSENGHIDKFDKKYHSFSHNSVSIKNSCQKSTSNDFNFLILDLRRLLI
jgi:hypothetical protein